MHIDGKLSEDTATKLAFQDLRTVLGRDTKLPTSIIEKYKQAVARLLK